MLYWLTELTGELSAFNIFRYITFRTGGALITALLFVFLFGPAIIRSLRIRQGKGQPIRADGPERHLLQKQGTPTMGGLMILSGVTVATLLWGNLHNPYVWVVLIVTLVYGAVGLYDDYLKVTRQSVEGSGGRVRLLIEGAVALIATWIIASVGQAPLSTALAIPFFKNVLIDLGWLFVPFGAFIIVGAGNAVNLTDGLDGLAIVPVMIAAATFGFISYFVGNILFAEYLQIHFVQGTGELAVVCGALVGAGLGFLWFNAPPAQIFMGIQDRSHSAARSAPSPSPPSMSWCSPSSAACSCWRRFPSSCRWRASGSRASACSGWPRCITITNRRDGLNRRW